MRCYVLTDTGSNEIQRVKLVGKQTQAFLTRRVPTLGKRAKQVLIEITRKSDQTIGPTPKTDQDIVDRLNSMSFEDLKTYVGAEVDRLKDARSARDQQRSKGFGKRASKLQEVLLTFDRFLSIYTGVVDIVKIAEPTSGIAAFAALSILFAVSSTCLLSKYKAHAN